MPRGDKRGPEGSGPMTGRALGYCAGNDQPGYTAVEAPKRGTKGSRNGRGCGRGHGRSQDMIFAGNGVQRRGRYSNSEVDVGELNSKERKNRKVTRLENLANTLSSELEIVKKQITELKNN